VLELALPQAYAHCLALGSWTIDYHSTKMPKVTY